ncbi:MAG: bifunctional 5,10-methylenetetrahydrofolate dehydrogenase/5,10-methenyltetrahydrofolate cyclohydrolase [Bacillota bacterium]
MEKALKGKEVALFVKERVKAECSKLRSIGVVPTMAIVRIGDNADDITYEKSIIKSCSEVGIEVKSYILPDSINMNSFVKYIKILNEDEDIHGYMIFRPLPKQLDEVKIKYVIDHKKDIESMNPVSLSKVFEGETDGIVPCTPAAVIEIMKYYNIEMEGKNAVVLGRSMVVGRPLSMMLLKEDATVTICHSKTKNLKEITSRADILVAALGKANFITREYVKPGAVIIDVGINTDENGKLCGDVDYDDVYETAGRITPVPGGIGSVTTALLFSNIVRATRKQLGI